MSQLLISDFQNAIYQAGYGCPDITVYEAIIRFHVDGDKAGTKNGWYVFFIDGRSAGGAFGSWKTGVTHTWYSKTDKAVSPGERKNLYQKIKAVKQKRLEDQALIHKQAAQTAQAMWNQLPEALFHSYLRNKQILPLGIRQRKNNLIIPLCDVTGKIWSYQSIDSAGKKMFMKNGKIRGCFYQIGDIKYELSICEGFATGASLFQATDIPVAVAFNCNNLKPVALALRKKYPHIKITLAADNDTKTKGNPGLAKGREAAAAIGTSMIYPNFEDESFDGDGMTDFNDYLNAGGLL